MSDNLIKTIMGGLTTILVAKDVMDSYNVNNIWKNCYEGKCNEVNDLKLDLKEAQLEVASLKHNEVVYHDQRMNLMKQNQQLAEENTQLVANYSAMVKQLMEAGFEFSPDGLVLSMPDQEEEPEQISALEEDHVRQWLEQQLPLETKTPQNNASRRRTRKNKRKPLTDQG